MSTDRRKQTTKTNRSQQEPAAEKVIPVIEEKIQVGTRVVESARVKVSKTVTQQREAINVPLEHEEVQVERVPRNEVVTGDVPQVRNEGDTTIIPVLREEVVVQKRLLLVEELHVRKKMVQTQSTVKATLKKEEVKVERKPAPRNDREVQ